MFVSKNDAEAFIKKFLEMKEILNDELPPNLDVRAVKYYTDPQNSFVFRREFVDGLFDGIDANALRIYYAAHDDGGPTIVLVACKVNDDNTLVENKMVSAASRGGSQHPTPPTGGGTLTRDNFDLDNDTINTQ